MDDVSCTLCRVLLAQSCKSPASLQLCDVHLCRLYKLIGEPTPPQIAELKKTVPRGRQSTIPEAECPNYGKSGETCVWVHNHPDYIEREILADTGSYYRCGLDCKEKVRWLYSFDGGLKGFTRCDKHRVKKCNHE